jgi:hypothetical protein
MNVVFWKQLREKHKIGAGLPVIALHDVTTGHHN